MTPANSAATSERDLLDDPEGIVSESEKLLFGGPLRYDQGWSRHEEARLELSLKVMVRRMPELLRTGFRLAWRADRMAARLVIGAEIGRGLAQAVNLLAVNQVLADLLADGSLEARMHSAAPALLAVTLAMITAALLRSVSTYATGRLEPKVERLATETYLTRAARVELAAIEDDAFHRLLDSAQYGAMAARRAIKLSTRVINALFSLIAAMSVLTVLHVSLLFMLVLMALPSAWSALITAQRRYRSYHTWVQHSRACQVIARMLVDPKAAPEIRVHRIGPFLLEHFRGMSEAAEAEQARLARLEGRTLLIAAALTGLATVATYVTLGALLLSGVMALAVAGTAVIAIRSGSGSLNTLVLELNSLNAEALFVGDLEQLNVEAERRAIPTGGLDLPEQPQEIRFEHVSFTYPGQDSAPALSDVSLTIPAGKIVALVGVNGAGKTTLVKLLAGLYQPSSGRICWDGVDTARADRDQLAGRVAMVAQDFVRWSFTARVNMSIGRPEAPITAERIQEAIDQAGAGKVVDSLPRGLGTLLGRGFRGGHEISGGQWQRIGIARAAYRRGDILIVDEPTAALDARAELEVFSAIRALADAGQTVVLITHRLASVRHADLIHVLDRGRVVESGSPDQLLANGGLYAELFELQARQFVPEGAPVRSPRASRPKTPSTSTHS